MCGFLGHIGDAAIDDKAFRQLLARSTSRGPDHAGVFRNDNCIVGFNRLSIQDLSEHGHQPMTDANGDHILLFNGEVYNHQELRKKFRLHDFKGHGDTETLFRLFLQEGIEQVIQKPDGMFAIAWIDLKAGRLWLARDRAGIKPLYYHIDDSGVVFASQLDQVVHFPVSQPHELSGTAVYDYFSLGYMIAPNTIYKSIRQVEPGQIVSFDLRERKIIGTAYFHRLNRTASSPNSDSDEVLRLSIEQSVKEQLVADVPVAAFMSGGIDSPVINATAIRLKPDLRAFTFQNKFEASLDESPTANALSQSLGMAYENISYDETDVARVVDDHFSGMPEPLGDFSTIPTYMICMAARRSATVVLSGDGGDELFYGYSRHISFFLHRHLFRFPISWRGLLARVSMKITGQRVSNSIRNHRTAGNAYRETQTSISSKDLSRMLGTLSFSDACDKVFSADIRLSPNQIPEAVSQADFYGFMQRVLRKVDMMSMSNSVEVRVPYLCNSLLEHARYYIPEIRSDADLKKPLKRVFEQKFPGLKPFRRKIGFTVPIEKILKGALRDDVMKYTLEKDLYGEGIIDRQAFRNYVSDYYAGKHRNHQGIWHLYAWQKWAYHQQLIKQDQ
jgi:asparagine synthase (glutamine-hydrolysing)